jgi:molecular chaperone GrpE
VELVYAELLGVLERAGLEPIAALGEPFDPNVHEAVMQDDGPAEPRVGGVLRTGWKLKGRMLRPAMVKVTRD